MIRFLPFVLIAVLILGGLGYWRFFAAKQSLEEPRQEVAEEPVEIPKTLPVPTPEIESSPKIKPSPQPQSDPGLESRLKSAETAVTELKARVSSLEKGTTTQTTQTVQITSKSPVFIPIGSNGQIDNSTDWISLGAFQASVDPGQYSGYTSMQLEVNIRLNQPGGKVHARLYSGGAIGSSEVSTDSTSSTLLTSGGFTLSGGAKTYTLQAKSTSGTLSFIDNARIKVNF